MATDEELDLALGTPRGKGQQPVYHRLTEAEWLDLSHSLERIDRRVERQSRLTVIAIAGGSAWAAGDLAVSYIGKGWVALGIAFVAFCVVGAVGQRDLDRDDLPAWLRSRR